MKFNGLLKNTRHPRQNSIIKARAPLKNAAVYEIPAFTDGLFTVTRWKTNSLRARIYFLFTGSLDVVLQGRTFPKLILNVGDFVDSKPSKNSKK